MTVAEQQTSDKTGQKHPYTLKNIVKTGMSEHSQI
jgi:hypothetical protein